MHDSFLKALQFSVLAAALGALTATAHAQSQGSWAMKAPVPARLNEVAVAAVGGGDEQFVFDQRRDRLQTCKSFHWNSRL